MVQIGAVKSMTSAMAIKQAATLNGRHINTKLLMGGQFTAKIVIGPVNTECVGVTSCLQTVSTETKTRTIQQTITFVNEKITHIMYIYSDSMGAVALIL